MRLADSWEAQSHQWIQWARRPGHDSYWRYHRDQFLDLLPSPCRQTVDIGCGEGRLTRHLKELGHQIVGIDASPSMVAAARELDPSMDIRLADAAALPLDDAAADLAVAFMSLHDIDAMSLAVREIARVLEPGGRLCFAIVHPINSAGHFERLTGEAPFVIEGDYLRSFPYSDTVERDGLTMTFYSQHRPFEAYFLALEEAGFLSRRCANRAFRKTRLLRKRAAAGNACRSFCICAPAANKANKRYRPLQSIRRARSARCLPLGWRGLERRTVYGCF